MYKSSLTPLNILKAGMSMLANRRYGSVKQIAQLHRCSRSSCYNHMHRVEYILNNFHLTKESAIVLSYVTKQQIIVREYLLHRSSVSRICEEVRFRNRGISKGEVSKSLHEIGSILPVFDTLPEGCVICCLVIDETFKGNIPYLVTIDGHTGYTLCVAKVDNRKAETWSFYLEQILADNKPQGLSISADFATQIQSCLKGLEIVFHGDLFHYFRILGKQLIGLWSKLVKLFGGIEEAHKTVDKTQKMLAEQLIPSNDHYKAVKKAERSLSEAYQQATLAMQHYDDARYLLLESKKAFAYFDNNGTWVEHQQAQQHLQTICCLGKEIPNIGWQKAISSFEKYIPAATQYIADIATEIKQLTGQSTDQNKTSEFLWQVVSLIHNHRRKANCCKQYVHQRYHQQQANQWESLLIGQVGKEKTQEMLAQISSVLAKANRSSSMVETVNSRLKPYLNGVRGQMSQERLNLIRFYLNHQPYERSRVAERKGFSPYQLFYQKQNDKRDWYTILSEDYINKIA